MKEEDGGVETQDGLGWTLKEWPDPKEQAIFIRSGYVTTYAWSEEHQEHRQSFPIYLRKAPTSKPSDRKPMTQQSPHKLQTLPADQQALAALVSSHAAAFNLPPLLVAGTANGVKVFNPFSQRWQPA